MNSVNFSAIRTPQGRVVRLFTTLGLAASAWALGSGAAQARGHDDVYWSIGVNAPSGVSVGVSNAPPPQRVVVRPAPVVVTHPAPVVVHQPYAYPQPVVVYQRPVVYPRTVVYPGRGWGPRWDDRRDRRHDRWHDRHDRRHDRHHDRWDD